MKLRLVRMVFGPNVINDTPTVVWEGEAPARGRGSIGTFDDGDLQIRRYFEVELSDRWQPILFDPRNPANRDKWEALQAYIAIEKGSLNLSCTCRTTSDELRRFLERLAFYTE